MKKLVYSLLILVTLVATVYVEPARAQSDRRLVVNVPFNFYVKDRALPAGEYTVALVQVAGADALKIQSRDGQTTAIIPSQAARRRGEQDKPQLLFNRYEDRYFLAQVSGLEISRVQQIRRSRSEDEVRVKTAGTPGQQNVAVAARKP